MVDRIGDGVPDLPPLIQTCKCLRHTPGDTKVWITKEALDCLEVECGSNYVKDARKVVGTDAYELTMEVFVYDEYAKHAKIWECSLSDCIIRIHKQEHV